MGQDGTEQDRTGEDRRGPGGDKSSGPDAVVVSGCASACCAIDCSYMCIYSHFSTSLLSVTFSRLRPINLFLFVSYLSPSFLSPSFLSPSCLFYTQYHCSVRSQSSSRGFSRAGGYSRQVLLHLTPARCDATGAQSFGVWHYSLALVRPILVVCFV